MEYVYVVALADWVQGVQWSLARSGTLETLMVHSSPPFVAATIASTLVSFIFLDGWLTDSCPQAMTLLLQTSTTLFAGPSHHYRCRSRRQRPRYLFASLDGFFLCYTAFPLLGSWFFNIFIPWTYGTLDFASLTPTRLLVHLDHWYNISCPQALNLPLAGHRLGVFVRLVRPGVRDPYRTSVDSLTPIVISTIPTEFSNPLGTRSPMRTSVHS